MLGRSWARNGCTYSCRQSSVKRRTLKQRPRHFQPTPGRISFLGIINRSLYDQKSRDPISSPRNPRRHTITPYTPPSVDRIWLWVRYHKIPIYPPFYLLKVSISLYKIECGVHGTKILAYPKPHSIDLRETITLDP